MGKSHQKKSAGTSWDPCFEQNESRASCYFMLSWWTIVLGNGETKVKNIGGVQFFVQLWRR